MKDNTSSTTVELPRPSRSCDRSLDEILDLRRSVREFTDESLSDEQISQLLWAAQGITHPEGLRSAPSAGALYPLELYLVDSSGLYHYDPDTHELRQRDSTDLKRRLWRASFAQDPLIDAPAVFVMTAVYARTRRKYGSRAERYVQIEVGHAAQNLLLEAVALGLGAVPVGAFDDDEVSKVLRIPTQESPLYLIPVGHPR